MPFYFETFKYCNDMRAPYGFNKAVLRHLGNIKVSSALISAVRKGKRKNDTILMAIIEVDHAMTHGKGMINPSIV